MKKRLTTPGLGNPARRRSRMLIGIGLILAMLCTGGVIEIVNAVASRSHTGSVAMQTVVVTMTDIPAGTAMDASSLTTISVPRSATNAQAFTNPQDVVGKVASIEIPRGQIVDRYMVATAASGTSVAIQDQSSGTKAPSGLPWRAVSVTVPDTLAAAGQVNVGSHVDVFATIQVNVPPAQNAQSTQPALTSGADYSDRSTKLLFSDVPVIAKNGSMYLLRLDADQAEQVNHLQAVGGVAFSFALRPTTDNAALTTLPGTTTNQILKQYQYPIPQVYP